VLSESHQGMAEISARQLLDLKHWQKIQDLFAEIIGANLWLIEPSGICLTTPSKVSGSCSDIVQSKTSQKASPVDCVFKALQRWTQQNENSYKCPHNLNYFPLPVRCNNQTIGVIVVGPAIVGKREEKKAYTVLCENLEIDSETFLDRVREIKIFSYHGIKTVLDFLRELTQHLVQLSYHRSELERLVPGFLAAQKEGDEFVSATYANLLANCLLEIASQVVHADSGSVMLVDQDQKNFSIKSAHGIKPEILKQRHLPLNAGIAGWVAARRKAILIGPRETRKEVPKEKLKRPQIKSSMVVPLEFKKKVLGVFCLNAKSANKRFNQNNLVLLDQLGKLASVALARVSLN